jgi:hypothetical protein
MSRNTWEIHWKNVAKEQFDGLDEEGKQQWDELVRRTLS